MPTYDYKCLECDTKFELFQSMTEDPIQECPDCSGKVKRLIGAGAALIFKGSGFYITDYRDDGYKEAAKKDKSPSSGEGEKSKNGESKSDGDKKSVAAEARKGSDSKSGDSKSGDSKSGDSKSGTVASSDA